MSTNADLAARRLDAVPRGLGMAYPVYIERAENSELWDVEGRRYIDFAGGIAVVNTGHRHPKVIAAVQEQMNRFTHTCIQVTPYEPYLKLAEAINARAPIAGKAKTVFFTTGAEAVENAVKIARAATGRPGVIAFTGGFHGRTMMGMALTGKVVPYKKRFGEMAGAVYHAPFPIAEHGVTVADSLKAIEFLFKADIDPDLVAAFILEPVQGEGGFYPAPEELLVGLRALCDKHGILLIADEVQTGFGRTGKLFAMEHSAVKPDLITMAKSLAGGFPLSGVVGRAEIMDAPEAGGLGGTYGGNPMACAAALAVIDVLEGEGLLARADAIGARLKSRLNGLRTRNDIVPFSAPRGPGAMIGFDILKSTTGYEPDADATKRVTAAALEEGLVLLSCGTYGNVIRILVPLTVSDAILDEAMDKLERALVKARI